MDLSDDTRPISHWSTALNGYRYRSQAVVATFRGLDTARRLADEIEAEG
jgi:hypothetical protein